jgi:hypothetical protein
MGPRLAATETLLRMLTWIYHKCKMFNGHSQSIDGCNPLPLLMETKPTRILVPNSPKDQPHGAAHAEKPSAATACTRRVLGLYVTQVLCRADCTSFCLSKYYSAVVGRRGVMEQCCLQRKCYRRGCRHTGTGCTRWKVLGFQIHTYEVVLNVAS